MFLLKMVWKDKNIIIKNTKSQSQKTVCKKVNFCLTKLTKPKTILKTQHNGTTFS